MEDNTPLTKREILEAIKKLTEQKDKAPFNTNKAIWYYDTNLKYGGF